MDEYADDYGNDGATMPFKQGGDDDDDDDEETEVVEADNGCVEMAVTSNSAATSESASALSLPRQPHPELSTMPVLVVASAVMAAPANNRFCASCRTIVSNQRIGQHLTTEKKVHLPGCSKSEHSTNVLQATFCATLSENETDVLRDITVNISFTFSLGFNRVPGFCFSQFFQVSGIWINIQNFFYPININKID